MTDTAPMALPERAAALAALLDGLPAADQPTARFWTAFLAGGARLCGASVAVLALPGGDGGWRKAAAWSAAERGAPDAERLPGWDVSAAAGLASAAGLALTPPPPGPVGAAPDADTWNLAVRLDLAPAAEAAVAVFRVERTPAAAAGDALAALRLYAGHAAVYQLRRHLDQARRDTQHYASVLDLMVLLGTERRFAAAAMALCNELASRHHCDRVSLGWLDRPYIRVRAISHVERFERKMNIVQALEAAMEECLDQDDELLWPAPEGSATVTRDLEQVAAGQGGASLCAVPLRAAGRPCAVLLAERRQPFAEDEVRHLRLAADQVADRLDTLRRADRWVGGRLWEAARPRLEALLGPRHTGAKLLAAAGTALAIWLVAGRLEYEIKAPFVLRSEVVGVVTAPFEAYIDTAPVEVGACVTAGVVLVTLDTRDLLLEEASALADRNRYLREVEKARAANEYADMRIAEAQAEQSRARLELVRRRVAQASVRAPLDGCVVEGDLRERLGVPVKTGDLLAKVARLDKLYVEMAVDEADIDDLPADGAGALAFKSQPGRRFAVRVTRIDPAAQAGEQGNTVTVRGAPAAAEAWWRPGMNGVARIRVGRRSPLWLLGHRTADYLRLRIWW